MRRGGGCGAPRLRAQPDRQERHDRVPGHQRAVTAAAGVVAASEIGELPPLRRGDQQLARVRIFQGRTCPPCGVRMVELLDGTIRTISAGDHFAPLPAKADVDRREAVQPPCQAGRVDARVRKEVDLPGAVRRGDDDFVREIGEGLLQPRHLLDRRLCVVREEDDRVALEELVRPARSLAQCSDRRVDLLERAIGDVAFRAAGVRGEVVAGEVVREKVEAVSRHQPAPDRGGVGVDRAGAPAADRERRSGPIRLEQSVEEEAAWAVGGAVQTGKRRQVAVPAAVARDVHCARDEAGILERLVDRDRAPR
jgi:hypothetical protein